uniref:Uncharacterized protein n=1 Tax=Arundo donax TaxID=35708 RepID=A0A0A9H4E4_ARUDO
MCHEESFLIKRTKFPFSTKHMPMDLLSGYLMLIVWPQ